MKHLAVSFALLLFCSLSFSQWTTPRLVDSSLTTWQGNPFVAVGPNREIAIVFTDGSRLNYYKSTDLGRTFTRIIVDSGSAFIPPGTYWLGTVPSGVSFDNSGKVMISGQSSYIDDIVELIYYGISVFDQDGRKTLPWQASANNGPGPPSMKKARMSLQDSTVHVMRGLGLPVCRVYDTRLGTHAWQTFSESVLFSFPNASGNQFDGNLLAGPAGVYSVTGETFYQTGKNVLYYSFALNGDTAQRPAVAVDTVDATSPSVLDIGGGRIALMYAAGTGATHSDTVLTVRTLTAGDTLLSAPLRLTAKPIQYVSSSTESNSPATRVHRGERYIVYRSYAGSTPMAAYYHFHDVTSAPVDTSFFPGYDYPDLALDSLGGSYLVMIGSDNKAYLAMKDVVNSVGSPVNVPLKFSLE